MQRMWKPITVFFWCKSTWLTSVGSSSLNVSRVREQEWVSGWWRGHGSPSTRASAELFTWCSVRSEGNTEEFIRIQNKRSCSWPDFKVLTRRVQCRKIWRDSKITLFFFFKFICWRQHISRLILHPHPLLLTSGTAQWSGHPFVHDEQCAVQPRALHGHLYLLDARVQGPLSVLLSGEDGAALAADLSRRWTHRRCGRGKALKGGVGFKHKRVMQEEQKGPKGQKILPWSLNFPYLWHHIAYFIFQLVINVLLVLLKAVT